MSSQATSRNTESLEMSNIVTGDGTGIVFNSVKLSMDHRHTDLSDDPTTASQGKLFALSSKSKDLEMIND